jgi:tRNA-specific 2-thiouridylase
MRPSPCTITIDGDNTTLTFDAPQKPTAPGQVAAFYVDDELIGGGIVSTIDG